MRTLSHLTPRLPLAWSSGTVRLRLTLLYGALFLISGAVLLAITYLLFRHATGISVLIAKGKQPKPITTQGGTGNPLSTIHQLPPAVQQARALAARDHAAELHQLLIQSAIALSTMAVISIALGWLVAGRVLRPLRTMATTTRLISEHNLHQRLAIEGPSDELTDLADTVNDLLERLEAAFGAQRRFVANAAHELRTPMTLLHALLEETLTDPTATIDSFRATSRRLITIGEGQERLLEALLTLASSERGLDHYEPFDLSVIADELVLAPRPDAEQLGLQIDANIAPAPTTGDPALAQRLVANLIDNAIQHNTHGGKIRLQTGTKTERAFISITNTGPKIPADELERLFEPFQRLGIDRTNQSDAHHGLGLSVVRAVATAHHATLIARARPEGGLTINVSFPITAPPSITTVTHIPSVKHVRRHERGDNTVPVSRHNGPT